MSQVTIWIEIAGQAIRIGLASYAAIRQVLADVEAETDAVQLAKLDALYRAEIMKRQTLGAEPDAHE